MWSENAMEPESRRKDDFLWGVATSAYQTEGGYNGEGEPQTNWAAAEQASHVAPLGKAAEFWTRFRDDFALCRDLGLNAFRLSIEWSRVQPTYENLESAPPRFDYDALDHYAGMLVECRRAGLEPVVTLHHFVHPAWLGSDPWLRPETARLFERFVDKTVRYLNYVLVAESTNWRRFRTILSQGERAKHARAQHLFRSPVSERRATQLPADGGGVHPAFSGSHSRLQSGPRYLSGTWLVEAGGQRQ